MTNTFQIGDTVVCHSPPGTGQLEKGGDYTVTEVIDDQIALDKWPTMLWYHERFSALPPRTFSARMETRRSVIQALVDLNESAVVIAEPQQYKTPTGHTVRCGAPVLIVTGWVEGEEKFAQDVAKTLTDMPNLLAAVRKAVRILSDASQNEHTRILDARDLLVLATGNET